MSLIKLVNKLWEEERRSSKRQRRALSNDRRKGKKKVFEKMIDVSLTDNFIPAIRLAGCRRGIPNGEKLPYLLSGKNERIIFLWTLGGMKNDALRIHHGRNFKEFGNVEEILYLNGTQLSAISIITLNRNFGLALRDPERTGRQKERREGAMIR